MSPEELQRATFAAWSSLVSRLVAGAPTVLVLEDLHWADPTSLHLTPHLASLVAGRGLLILATSGHAAGGDQPRTFPGPRHASAADYPRLPGAAERRWPVPARRHASQENRTPCGQRRRKPLVPGRAVVLPAGDEGPGPRARHMADERDGGKEVPEALERLTGPGWTGSARPRGKPSVPAAPGTEFPRAPLMAVRATNQPLGPALDELCAKDLLQEAARLPEPAFRFRHALIQEAVYNGLLRAERRCCMGAPRGRLRPRRRAGRKRSPPCSACTSPPRESRTAPCGTSRWQVITPLPLSPTTRRFPLSGLAGTHSRAACEHPGDGRCRCGTESQARHVLGRTGRRGQAREALGRLWISRVAGTYSTKRICNPAGTTGAATSYEAADGVRRGRSATRRRPRRERRGHRRGVAGTDGGWPGSPYTMRDEPERVLATLAAVRPLLETRGTPARRYSFYMHLAYGQVMEPIPGRRGGYRQHDKGLAAAAQGDEEKDVGYGTYFLRQVLWLRGDLTAAQKHMEQALAMAERIGERLLLGQSSLGLAFTALRRHDPDAMRIWAPRALAAADGLASSEYLTGAKACLAWLAWQTGIRKT